MRTALSAGPVVLMALFCIASAGTVQKKPSIVEQDLVDAVNRERQIRKLPMLKWDEGLARAARKHAELMAEGDLLQHQLPGETELAERAHEAGARFSHITENIGMAEFADTLHEAWMNSPGHRANILDPQIDSIGVAVVDEKEKVFAVQDFALSVEPLSLQEQEKRISALLTARGLQLLNISDPDKKNCGSQKGLEGSRRPGYISRYETTNVSQLSEDVERELHLARYKSAAVEACPQKETARFTSFHIIVVLY